VTLHRFFVAASDVVGDHFIIPASIERQVSAVLRLRDGDRIVLLTDDGAEAICRLQGGEVIVEERRASLGEPRHRLTVVQALLKGDGLEEVVQHGTELGVAAFRPVVTDRCIVRELSSRRLDRLRRIAREAAEQSERGRIPEIHSPGALREAFLPGSVLLLERNEGSRLSELDPPSSILIGPEGGFTAAEVESAAAAGVRLAGLGPRILRSETVAVAAAAAILSRTGDFA